MSYDAAKAQFEAEFREAIRRKFKIEKMLEVAVGGLDAMLIKTHVTQHQLVESEPYADWSCRLAWWKAIAQAGGMIAENVEGPSGVDQLMELVLAARRRMQE